MSLVKYRRLPTFDRDYKELSEAERTLFREALAVFIESCKKFEAKPAGHLWPKSLRFEKLAATARIHAITWSFSGPDGRATFHFESHDGEMFVVWRRVGRHDIYREP